MRNSPLTFLESFLIFYKEVYKGDENLDDVFVYILNIAI